MTIETLKTNLDNKTLDDFYIFFNLETSFLSNQYVNAIAQARGLKLIYIDDLRIYRFRRSKNIIFIWN